MQPQFLFASCRSLCGASTSRGSYYQKKDVSHFLPLVLLWVLSLLENHADDGIHVTDIDAAIVIHVGTGNT